ncbi:MAG: DUF1579 family protein [Chthoniobacterales bacterium]
MRQIILLTIAALSLTVPGRVTGEEPIRGKGLNDPLLDKLVGDWNVERKFPSGRIAKNVVHIEWVLQHQFVELHYRDVATPPAYEAIVLIGYDSVNKSYVCHWTDNFGADNSAEGLAPRDEGSNAIEFKFTFHDGGELTNRFAFDPRNRGWISTIRQTEKGEWKLFCEDTFTRANAR